MKPSEMEFSLEKYPDNKIITIRNKNCVVMARVFRDDGTAELLALLPPAIRRLKALHAALQRLPDSAFDPEPHEIPPGIDIDDFEQSAEYWDTQPHGPVCAEIREIEAILRAAGELQ